ncbi:MAG: ferritin [Bacteroidales bacterium]|jgi:ferritin|nr:ferritin [Bacteroidales bacterium]
MKKKLEDICNRQVEREAYSSNLYLAMASWAETKGMAGVAEWLYAQSDEERMHMMKFVKFINERGGHAIIPQLEKPPVDYKGVNEMFDEVLHHEKYISESINEIVAMAGTEKDYALLNWIQWFVSEQVEEESSVQAIIDKLNLIGSKNLYMFDRDIMKMRSEEDE